MTTTTNPYRPLLDVLGVDTVPAHVTAYLEHLGVAGLTDDELAAKLGICDADYPMHRLVAAAFGPDGDEAALAEIRELVA